MVIATFTGIGLADEADEDGVFRMPRAVWMRERSGHFWREIVLKTWTDKDWHENFRMKRGTFKFICDALRDQIEMMDTHLRKSVPTERRVAVTLWRLSTNNNFRTIGHLFGVAQCTVVTIVNSTCKAIVDILFPEFVKFPENEDLKRTVEMFKVKWGFPQCCGAVDGSHIPIIAPSASPIDYFCRKHYYNIILQGVADADYRFIDVNIGWPGSVHDARVFALSDIYEKAENGELFPQWTQTINDVEVPLVLLGDSAYPLLKWCMKPYPDNGRLTREQKHFNYRLSRARMVIENAFGRLKGRWRILMKRCDSRLKNMNNLIASCVVLHNICETFKEVFKKKWLRMEAGDNGQSSCRQRDDPNAVHIRNALKTYLYDD